MAKFARHIIYLTEDQRQTLFSTGSVVIKGVTYEYCEDDIYVTPQVIHPEIGSVTSLDFGEDAFVTLGGTAENPVFSFGIPKGYSPKKGTDYWTQADIDEMKEQAYDEITEAVADSLAAAQRSAEAAEQSNTEAKQAQNNAEGFARNASGSAGAASGSAEDADDSAKQAKEYLDETISVAEGIAQEATASQIFALTQSISVQIQELIDHGMGGGLNGFSLTLTEDSAVLLTYTNPDDETDTREALFPTDSTG